LTKALARRLSFSSERLSEFRRLVSWLVSQGAGHCQPYVNPRITLVLGLVQWAQATQLTVELVYYPPYRSKYNPIERCWGVLEVYWNGELLDSEEAVLGFAANMTYAGRHPHVDRVSAAYCSGVRRSSAEKKLLEGRLMRQPSLPKWSVTIAPPKPDEIILPA